jgi:hypothetical protein
MIFLKVSIALYGLLLLADAFFFFALTLKIFFLFRSKGIFPRKEEVIMAVEKMLFYKIGIEIHHLVCFWCFFCFFKKEKK